MSTPLSSNQSLQQAIFLLRNELSTLYPAEEIHSFTRLIFEQLLAYSPTDILLNQDTKLTNSSLISLKKVIDRLKKYEPLQYILGETEFYGIKLELSPAVLIPRPETEELVDWMLKKNLQKARILDIGTGSGSIAISLAKNLPDAELWAMDVSEQALAVAKRNATKNNCEISWRHDSILHPTLNYPIFDWIVSNPPYVCESEKKLMQNNVLLYEPSLALFVKDQESLLFYKQIALFANKHLKDGGKLFLEINEQFGVETSQMLESYGFEDIQLRKDINEKDRMLCATKKIN